MPVSANRVPVILTAARPVLPLTGDLAGTIARKAPPWIATLLTAFFLCILKDRWLEILLTSLPCSPTQDASGPCSSQGSARGGQQRAEEQLLFPLC